VNSKKFAFTLTLPWHHNDASPRGIAAPPAAGYSMTGIARFIGLRPGVPGWARESLYTPCSIGTKYS